MDDEQRRETGRWYHMLWEWIADNRWFVTILILTVLGICLAESAKEDAQNEAAKAAQVTTASPTPAPKDAATAAPAAGMKAPVTAAVTADKKKMAFGTKVSLLLFAALMGWFLDIFTGDATKRKVNQMVAFCYIFPFAIFAGILMPLFAFPIALPNPPKPVGIILGCNDWPTLPVDRDLVPDGIRCYNNSDQWLVNIGGHAVYLDPSSRRQGEDKIQALAKTKRDTQETVRTRNPGADPKEKPVATPAAETPKDDTGAAATPAAAPTAPKTPPYDVTDQFRVTGGLVVPLYFVMLAIFGGFVSMLRRVPEYQERVSEGAVDRLSLDRAREKLVFEVLQLLAAPLIAVTAYYLIDPSSRASSIALAFIAGFSSETVLLYVRALTEKLQPETSRRTQPVDVVPATVDFKKQAVNTTSAPHSVSLTNRTNAPLSGNVTVSGEFGCAQAGLPFSVPAGGVGTFNVTFAPTSAGAKTGQLQIVDNGPSSPRVVTLQGMGVAPGGSKPGPAPAGGAAAQGGKNDGAAAAGGAAPAP